MVNMMVSARLLSISSFISRYYEYTKRRYDFLYFIVPKIPDMVNISNNMPFEASAKGTYLLLVLPRFEAPYALEFPQVRQTLLSLAEDVCHLKRFVLLHNWYAHLFH
jgi:hypothetical protein